MNRLPNCFAALGLLTLGAAACSTEDGPAGKLSLARVDEQFASRDCPQGGHEIETGLDDNRNAQLDDDEVTSVSLVCNGAEGEAGEPAAGGPGEDGASGTVSGVLVSDVPAGSVCEYGGQRVEVGVDANADGEIDEGVVTDTVYVCNGGPGAAGNGGRIALVTTTPEPASANCANGGQRIDHGLDSNADGALQPSEVDGTRYVCERAPGTSGVGSVVVSTAEPAGANCPSGGQRLDHGRDANGNGALEPSEVAGSTYACSGANGANGTSSLVNVDVEAPGNNCAAGGSKITHGIDDDGSGALEPAEVDGTRYACNGADGSDASVVRVSVEVEPSGGNCTGGGHVVKVGLDDNADQTLQAEEVDSTSYVCDFDDFRNPSFELPDYAGWTVGSTSSGQWLLVTSGTTLNRGDSAFDYADKRNETLNSIGLPTTFTSTAGTLLAVQQQSAPGVHRIYQDFTVPIGTTTLDWDMYYKNTAASFNALSQYIAINVRDPSDDSVLATLYKTAVGDPLVLSQMTPFSADLTAFAGRDIRFDIETNIKISWMDVALDNFDLH
ncbi:MAG: Phage tail fiber protein [Polyangiaceae bacterium]|jgi:hypothetical protein|nr:Phage tail fiber protein [Polyangiaceae bacterium]